MKKIKNINLKQLSENLWMADRDAVLSGSNIYVKNMSLRGAVMISDKLVRIMKRNCDLKKIYNITIQH